MHSCRDDNDAAKKYKNNFILADAIGNSILISSAICRNHLLKDA